MRKFWEYRSLPIAEVLGITLARSKHPDSYLSDDECSRAYFQLLSRGFRWVRTEEGHAIFERERLPYAKTKD